MSHVPDGRRWNHNIQYHPVILDAVPPGAARALDVGCGEGVLTRALAAIVPDVVGLDPDSASIAAARAQGGAAEYVQGDLLSADLEPSSFDLTAAVAVLHHLDLEAALTRMAELTRPGGVLAVVGLARQVWPRDLALDGVGFVATRLHQLRKREWTTPAPKVWPPPLTFAETRSVVERTLPGCRYRRHVLWRWSATWRKPMEDRAST